MSNPTPTHDDKSEKIYIKTSESVQAREDQRYSPREIERKHVQAKTHFKISNTTPPSTSGQLWPGIQQSAESPRLYQGSSGPGVRKPIALTHEEALLLHHYTEHLGRWLDCSNASHIFTLVVPLRVRQHPILCQAVLCFAARHRREDRAADAAYQCCITLLIDRLNNGFASNDDILPAAVVILHFAEQLNDSSTTSLFDKPHLAACSAIFRASQGTRFVDPSAPCLRDAAFWVYVRQSLYNATIHQRPLDVDFTLKLHPAPDSIPDSHSLAWLGFETAWANQMIWNTACVAQFCFAGTGTESNSASEIQWQELWKRTQIWHRDRPGTFDPTGSGFSRDGCVFLNIWFTSDWHSISFIFYHFSCILLLIYTPGTKFAIRSVHSKSLKSNQILDHSRAICCACESLPENPQLGIILCHTVFIWGPLLSKIEEQNEVIHLLQTFEKTHSWNTFWIISALKAEWGMDLNV